MSSVTDTEFELFLHFILSGDDIDPKKTLKQITLEIIKGETDEKPVNNRKHYKKDELRISKKKSATESGSFQQYINNL